jgi:hypothetical protein
VLCDYFSKETSRDRFPLDDDAFSKTPDQALWHAIAMLLFCYF